MCYTSGYMHLTRDFFWGLKVLCSSLHLNLWLQLDFQLPIRFKLSYSAEDEAKSERPVMIHRAILGSVERMLAILLEHYKGKWPFWLSPRQAIVCPVSEKSQPYALQVSMLLSVNTMVSITSVLCGSFVMVCS